jgi:hypothetical protein
VPVTKNRSSKYQILTEKERGYEKIVDSVSGGNVPQRDADGGEGAGVFI